MLKIFKRYKVKSGKDFQWTKNLITPNLFRCFEVIFGRRIGVRPEVSTLTSRDIDGNVKTTKIFHSWESLIVESEIALRKFLAVKKNFKTFWDLNFADLRIYVPALDFGIPGYSVPYLFAISVGSTSTKISPNGTTTTLTNPHTVSGSNICMVIGGGERSSMSSAVYNTIPFTLFTNASYSVQNARQGYIMYPCYGTNDVVGTFSSGWCTMHVTTYSGVNSISHGGNNGSATNVTSMASASVAVGSTDLATDYLTHGSSLTVGGSQTQLANTSNTNANGSSYRTGAGTYTLTWTSGAGSVWAGSVAVLTAAGADTCPVPLKGKVLTANTASQDITTTEDTSGADGCIVWAVNYSGATPSSVSVAGTTATKVAEYKPASNYCVAIYYAYGFAQGTNKTINVTWAAGTYAATGYMLLSGAKQSATVGNTSNAGSSTKVSSYTSSLTTGTANSLVIEASYINLHSAEDLGTITPQMNVGGFIKYGPNNLNGIMSWKKAPTATSYTTGYSWTGNTEEYTTLAVEILAATGGGGSTFIPLIIQS